jgi:AcrR family transcriptional regulator
MKTKKVLGVRGRPDPEKAGTRERILETARTQLYQYGFSRTTTDEIASLAGMSKATLYKYFSSKEDLLREIVFGVLGEIETGVNLVILDEEKDFVEKLRDLLTFIGLKLAEMGRLLLDVQKNAPLVWKEIEAFRRDRILSKLNRVIKEGIDAGVFRPDFNQDLLVLMYVTLIQNIMNPATLVRYSLSFAEGFEMIIKIVFEGILTKKSRARYLSGGSRRKSSRGR